MSHLHIPDGVLPPVLWAAGLAVALLAMLVSGRASRDRAPRRIALQGALGAMMLAVMSVPIPLFALEYCLTLAGPVGVLLGPAASFQVVSAVCLILALLGQGGLTVVGLNALVMGAGAAVARPVFARCVSRFGPAGAMAIGTGAAQALSGLAWFALIALALRLAPGAQAALEHGGVRFSLLAGLTLALWLIAILAESGVAYGIGRFLFRVRPDLLPLPAGEGIAPGAGPARRPS
jgi:cobalt/nickel transport system permease protein